MNEDKLMKAVEAVYADFMPAEAAADLAAARTARLLATILEQRAETELSIGSGAVLVRKLAKSLAAQIEARDEFIMAHKLAVALPAELGIEAFGYGDTETCPDAIGAAPQRNVVRLAAA